MNREGFTLVEVLISVFILCLILIYVVGIYSGIIHTSRDEEMRILALNQNIKVIEQLKDKYYSSGDSMTLFHEYTYSEDLYGDGVLYETSVCPEKINIVSDEENIDDGIYKVTYGSDDLVGRAGSNSELYRVEVKTKVRGKSIKGTDMVVYLSPVRKE